MTEEEQEALLEGLLFVSGEEGIDIQQLMEVMSCSEDETENAVQRLQESCSSSRRGMQVKRFADTVQLTTKEVHAPYFKKLVQSPSSAALSQAALEALAVIAYRQPVSRLQVEDVRGVRTDRPIRTLQAKGLIEEKGRHDGAGRAILYGTTEYFLEQFGLRTLEDLPPLPETETEEEEEFDLFFERFQQAVQPD
ncbi:SMC-Scp complex subunit ScpB [Alkalicoccus chagannorensis]|uniref:SMC-Scp complex subunit ScpB n=1 Tax=Alkalicoccus chagannorensis TaxID=427072 RepID=UPI00040D5A04|nr:SMC-Scp complex subunit ScpB [Alkalicoccus chagannorensis]